MKYDIAVAMSTYFDPYGYVTTHSYRRGLFHQALYSLRRVDWGDKKAVLVLRDDHSGISPNAEELRHLGIDLDYKVRPTHSEEINANYWECIWDAAQVGEWVLMMDDDGLACSDIIKRLWGLVELYPDSAVYGSYNSHLWPTVETKVGHVLKSYTTELGMLFRSADLTYKGTSLLATILNGRPQQDTYPCLSPSAMQHQGAYGLNNGNHDDYDPDFIYY